MNNLGTKQLETERLILRQWNVNDIDDIVEGLNNINVTKWLAGAPFPYTIEDAKHFVQKTIDNDLYNFAIILKSENKVSEDKDLYQEELEKLKMNTLLVY